MGLVVTVVAMYLFQGRFTEHKQRACMLALARDRSAATSRIHLRIAALSNYEEETARGEASARSSWSCVFSNSALVPLGSFNVPSIYTVYRLEMQLSFCLSLFLTLSLSRYMFRQ
jgi:hypothetical protein